MNKTIEFFKEIVKIPRESGNETGIANYVIEFAKKRNLSYETDQYNNVIIKKYINQKDPIILQCHLDMVCEKEMDKDFDFSKDEIELIEEDGFFKANSTSLGADNGIGIAQILNILDNDNLNTSIEAIFTTSEETTMKGAEMIDISSLRGKIMLNLDGFDSDTILIESASFTDIDIKLDYDFEKVNKKLYEVKLSGLEGGHSGFDIDKDRGNSIFLLAEFLEEVEDLEIGDFKGGTKINVIPSSSYAVIKTDFDLEMIRKKYLDKKDISNMSIEINELTQGEKTLDNKNSFNFLKLLTNLKQGVINKNKRGEVTTSLNLAKVDLKANLLQLGLRSSVDMERKQITEYLEEYFRRNNCEFIISGYQPGFKINDDSDLVNKLSLAYEKQNLKTPDIKSVHISVEAGILKEKFKDLEVAIISPNIIGAHSYNEKVEIESIYRCDRWLEEFLRSYN